MRGAGSRGLGTKGLRDKETRGRRDKGTLRLRSGQATGQRGNGSEGIEGGGNTLARGGAEIRDEADEGYSREATWALPRASRAPVTRPAAWRTTLPSLAKSPAMQRTPMASTRSMSAAMGEASSAA